LHTFLVGSPSFPLHAKMLKDRIFPKLSLPGFDGIIIELYLHVSAGELSAG